MQFIMQLYINLNMTKDKNTGYTTQIKRKETYFRQI